MQKTTRFFLSLLLACLVPLFTVGCGSSSEDFVITPTQPTPTPTTVARTNLVFRFDRVAAQTLVPTQTDRIRFDLYSSDPPVESSFLDTETRLYADVIVLNDVPENVESVVVTLLDENGLPIRQYTVSIDLVVGTDVEVDVNSGTAEATVLSDLQVTPDPINLIVSAGTNTNEVQLSVSATVDGQSLPVPVEDVQLEVDDSGTVVLRENGLLTARTNILFIELGEGDFLSEFQPPMNTTLTATYTLNDVVKEDRVPVNVYSFGSFIGLYLDYLGLSEFPLPPGEVEEFGLLQGFILVGPDSVPREIDAALAVRTVEPAVPGVSVNAEGGLVIAESVPLGTRFTLVSTFVDNAPGGSGLTFVERAGIIVSDAIF